jgi:hypothetical protein
MATPVNHEAAQDGVVSPAVSGNRMEGYAAFAAGWSSFRLKAAGLMKPCRSISRLAL